jgi:hypothetical protein
LNTRLKSDPILRENPFLDGVKLFVIGSSRVIHNGCLDGVKLKDIESGGLPNDWSTQTCELFSCNQALKFFKHKE